MRQKIGNDRLILASVDTVCVDNEGRILMVYSRDFDGWAFPGGSVELGFSWAESAVQEVLEEATLIVEPANLTPFASISGAGFVHEYADGSAQFFSIGFIAHTFTQSRTQLDAGEIAKTQWFTIAEAQNLKKTQTSVRLLPAYQKYLKTGQFQQIVVRDDRNEKTAIGTGN